MPLLAIAGLAVLVAQRSQRLAILLGLGVVVPALLALGTNLPLYETVWRHFPPLRYPRVPERLLPIACLALAALAAIAIDQLRAPLLTALADLVVAVDLRAGVSLYRPTFADEDNAAYAALADRGPGRLLELPVFIPERQYGSVYLSYAQQAPRERPGGYSTTAPKSAERVAALAGAAQLRRVEPAARPAPRRARRPLRRRAPRPVRRPCRARLRAARAAHARAARLPPHRPRRTDHAPRPAVAAWTVRGCRGILAACRTARIARRMSELERLREQRRAISAVLRAVASSQGLQPVLDEIVEAARRLCDGDHSQLYLLDGDVFRIHAASEDTVAGYEYAEAHPHPLDRTTVVGRAGLARDVVQIPDVLEDPDYNFGGQSHRRLPRPPRRADHARRRVDRRVQRPAATCRDRSPTSRSTW